METENRRHVGFVMKKLDNEIHSRITALKMESGEEELTMMQCWIIKYLYQRQEEDIFQKNIEADFSIARSTATGILQLMEKKGYIQRVSVERDARLKKIILTQKGIEQEETTRRNIQKIESMLVQGISEEEMDVFYRVIEKMRSNIEWKENETDRRRS